MYTSDFLLTPSGTQIPAFWGRQVKSQPSQTAGELLAQLSLSSGSLCGAGCSPALSFPRGAGMQGTA